MSRKSGDRFSDKDMRKLKTLERFCEPWRVTHDDDMIAVRDANGVVLVELSHRDNNNQLSDAEAVELARLIALLPVLSRRPQY
jgi:hypothetical protein